jgi:hypothetical protein
VNVGDGHNENSTLFIVVLLVPLPFFSISTSVGIGFTAGLLSEANASTGDPTSHTKAIHAIAVIAGSCGKDAVGLRECPRYRVVGVRGLNSTGLAGAV